MPARQMQGVGGFLWTEMQRRGCNHFRGQGGRDGTSGADCPAQSSGARHAAGRDFLTALGARITNSYQGPLPASSHYLRNSFVWEAGCSSCLVDQCPSRTIKSKRSDNWLRRNCGVGTQNHRLVDGTHLFLSSKSLVGLIACSMTHVLFMLRWFLLELYNKGAAFVGHTQRLALGDH